MRKRPGQSTEKDGGVFQEVDPHGKKQDNFAAVPDGKSLPPTSKAGNKWEQILRTPDSKR